VKIKTLYTFCEQVGRREKDYEVKDIFMLNYGRHDSKWRTGVTLLGIHNMGTKWRRVISFTLRLFYSGKGLPAPIK
jgi:hypothetical protein